VQGQQGDTVGSALSDQAFSFPWALTSSADGIFIFGTGPGPSRPEVQTEAQEFRFDSVDVEKEESLSNSPYDPGVRTMATWDDVDMPDPDRGDIGDNGDVEDMSQNGILGDGDMAAPDQEMYDKGKVELGDMPDEGLGESDRDMGHSNHDAESTDDRGYVSE
jgi:hypothetical protein